MNEAQDHGPQQGQAPNSDPTEDIHNHAQHPESQSGEPAMMLGDADQPALDHGLPSPEDLLIEPAPRSAPADVHASPHWAGEPVAFTQPHSSEAEDYRSIRNALALRWFKHPQGEKSLAVISTARHEGRSLMAANIAVCCAQVGFRTLLVDADMRHPSLHQLFNLDDSKTGFSACLTGQVRRPEYQPIATMPSLCVLPVGVLPLNPQELLLRNSLDRFVAEAKEQFEMIIFDTPAASVGSDYQIIGAAAGGALMVTHQALTKVRHARHLVGQCKGFGIRVVGSAMLAGG